MYGVRRRPRRSGVGCAAAHQAAVLSLGILVPHTDPALAFARFRTAGTMLYGIRYRRAFLFSAAKCVRKEPAQIPGFRAEFVV